ncbi:MAG: hypothetical protein CSA50_03840 [Gammaproteobacteria bacterium]|nr:MAG: hypothetical protein CSA50_03840 [Gammaproteobacteria bacterium]
MIFDEYLLKSKIKTHDNCPYNTGKRHYDLQFLYTSPVTMHMVADALVQKYLESDITHIAVVAPYGLTLGSIMAYSLARPMIILHPSSELAGEWHTQDIYNSKRTMSLSKQVDLTGAKVLLFDDVIRTGETLVAASTLLKKAGGEVDDACCIAVATEFGGASTVQELGINLTNLLAF